MLRRVQPFAVRLRRRRFEIGVALAIPLLVGLWGMAIVVRLDATAPRSCVATWGASDGVVEGACLGPMRAWNDLMTAEGDKFMGVMALVPFVVGLLATGPLVARVCEEGTAQTAWWLHASRRRWLMVELGPVLVVVPSTALAAAAATPLAELRLASGLPGSQEMGLSGFLVLARLLGALGIGLMAGALVQRVLPALLFGALLCWALALGVGWARDQWVVSRPAVALAEGAGGVVVRWEWRSPEGETLTDAEAMALVPEAVSRLDAGQPQAVHSSQWLTERGFRLVPVGIPDEALSAWAPYEGVLFGLAGLFGFGASFGIVDRIRPR